MPGVPQPTSIFLPHQSSLKQSMMAKGDTVVASLTLRRSYLKKLVFPKAVIQTRDHLLPPTLVGQTQTRQAHAILMGGNRKPLPVTFSRGRNHDRLVLLQRGWKNVVKKLGLKEGDQVIISLDDMASSTYSIFSPSLQSEHKSVIMKFDLNKPPEESDEEEMD